MSDIYVPIGHTLVTQDGQTVVMADMGVKPGPGDERYRRCCKCSLTYPESDFMWYNGKPYGVPCGCYTDIRRLRMRDAGELRRRVSNGSYGDRDSSPEGYI